MLGKRRLPFWGAMVLLVLVIVGFSIAATLAPIGTMLPTQHGIYRAPGSGVTWVPLSVSNTSTTLAQNGSWTAIGFQLNATASTTGSVVFLNASGGAGHLDLYNLSVLDMAAVQANQTFSNGGAWLNETSVSIELFSYVMDSAYYFLFLNVGSTSLTVTYNLNVVPLG